MTKWGRPTGAALLSGSDAPTCKYWHADEMTLFQAGSISKTITALGAVQILQAMGIELDDDVNSHLRSWKLPTTHRVTIRQLLGHTAGVNVPFFPGYLREESCPSLIASLDGGGKTAAVSALGSGDGTFLYSGGAYAVVQSLVNDLDPEGFAAAMDRACIQPLGLTSTTYEQDLDARRMQRVPTDDSRVYPEAAAAGMWTTPYELATLLAVLVGAAGREPTDAIATAAQTLTAKHTTLSRRGQWRALPVFGIRAPDSAGLGIFLEGSDRVLNLGGAYGYISFMAASLDGSGVVVMSAARASPGFFKVVRTAVRCLGWEGFEVSARGRMAALPSLRYAL
jgi:CubicO group peptidase (beta-lactamase class C family)